MINVLILDDDPMVAKWNNSYVGKLEGFRAAGTAHTYEEAKRQLNDKRIDLLLLDIYIGADNGLELLQELRAESLWEGDVILITAASDAGSVKKAMRYGAVDYIMKPFDFERFQEAMMKYRSRRKLFEEHTVLDQQKLDEQWFPKGETKVDELPKGLSDNTFLTVIDGIIKVGKPAFSTEDVAAGTGISRVTVRKYLKYMAETGMAGERLIYGTVGRPQHLFLLDDEQQKKLLERVKE
ncbi:MULTISPECIES: response regulator [Alteribacter]|uniref:Response regulator n=1 Tax=Alteribacter keqinensis TaxID=2483800 RepID=A0A3M7TTU0_9BACI|nr:MULTISPECIES: response regulator [Alteribacter]MBM7097330.1 response regulator [Alteribacter salitolerans]RNA68937.1 response regulator [Alteribacter keqinensis]